MKKAITMVVSVLLIALMLVACGSAEKKLIGAWTIEEDGITLTYNFEKDGKGNIDLGGMKMDFEWKVDGKKLSIDMAGDTIEGEFKISGDTLTIDANGEKMELKKAK